MLNAEYVAVSGELAKLRRQVSEAKARLKRNPDLRAQLTEELEGLQDKVRTLEARERKVETKRARSAGRKKLTIF